jgi:hypothetical protein
LFDGKKIPAALREAPNVESFPKMILHALQTRMRWAVSIMNYVKGWTIGKVRLDYLRRGRLLKPTSLKYFCVFPRNKAAGTGPNHSPPSSEDGSERLQLYLYMKTKARTGP